MDRGFLFRFFLDHDRGGIPLLADKVADTEAHRETQDDRAPKKDPLFAVLHPLDHALRPFLHRSERVSPYSAAITVTILKYRREPSYLVFLFERNLIVPFFIA